MAGTTANFKVMEFRGCKDHLILARSTEAADDSVSHNRNGTYGVSKTVSIMFKYIYKETLQRHRSQSQLCN